MRNHRPYPAKVPSTQEVIAGALVNIVLKADQPTGRTVCGTVMQVLTRGNHPRGIKVRLTDGRVGRVQTMASGTVTSPAPGAEAGATALGDGPGVAFRAESSQLPSHQIGLDAYIKPAKQSRRGGRKANSNTAAEPAGDEAVATGLEYDGVSETAQEYADEQKSSSEVRSDMVTCPVCEVFTGDEAAVAHHVAGHFDG
jgi:uncharacterized repeat protein (TIGR03833 family)